MIPLSLRIRQDLSTMHSMVEANPRLALLVSPDLSVENYVDVLKRLYGFYRPLEESLSANSAWLPSILRDTPRWPRLKTDLAWWGIDVANLPLAAAADLPEVQTSEAATGIAYVLEGAALGGKLIARHVQRALQISADNGVSFHAEGTKLASHWQRVREALDECPNGSHDAIISAAASTYQKLHDWV